MDEKKRIAIMVKDRQGEAFRMSLGLAVLDDEVDIFMTAVVEEGHETAMRLEALEEFGIKICSAVSDERFEYVSYGDMATRLLEYDRVLRY